MSESINFFFTVKFTVDDSNLYSIWLNDSVLDSEGVGGQVHLLFCNNKRTGIDQYVFQLWRLHNSFRKLMPYKIASGNACNSLVYV